MSKTRPIIFNSEMVRAILEGRKTQTRRVIKPQPIDILPMPNPRKPSGRGWVTLDKKGENFDNHGSIIKCPYGFPGDRLWVREKFIITRYKNIADTESLVADVMFKAGHSEMSFEVSKDNFHSTKAGKGTHASPPIHMPRWASRITLEITDVRVERLHEITVGDLIAEGIIKLENAHIETYPLDLIVNRSEHYTIWSKVWDSIYAKRGYPFSDNPWVWVVELEVKNV